MRPFFKFSATVVAVCLTTAPLAAADAQAGKDVSRQCSVCHGKLGVAKDPEVPNLAGQSAFYIEKSLKDYKSGAREDRRMTLISQQLSDEDIKNVAAWYASFSVTVTPPEE